MKRLRRAVAYTAFLIVMSVVGFILLEAATRLFGPDDLVLQAIDPDLLDTRNGNFLYVNRAGYHGVFRGNTASINSQHLLGPELANDGRPRLLLLGDSVLFARGLRYDDTPGPVLERMLGGKFAVLNASCIGYSTEHELAYLQEFGDSLRPSMVVVGYCLNDPMSPKAMNLVGVASAKSEKWGGPLLMANLILRGRSLFFVWLKGALGAGKRQYGYAAAIAPLFNDESWARNRQALLDMAAWCRTRNLPFMVAVFPYREQFEIGESSLLPQRRLLELSSEFPVIDLTTSVVPDDFMYGDNVHFDRNGIRKTMTVLARAVKDTQRNVAGSHP